MRNIFDHLKKRDFIDAITSESLFELANESFCLYLGFDPTAESLHLGSLVGIVALEWFRRFGHQVIALVGGATGRIGDPSGKSVERPLLTDEAITRNVMGIKAQLLKLLNGEGGAVSILDNSSWISKMNVIEFLRDVGKHFRLGTMLGKEAVKLRMESEEGMSFTEFSYQLLQAYDFHYLGQHHDAMLQIGGSDQWGNIVAGIDLSRKLKGSGLFGMTFPLLTRSDGKKFGKSEEGTIWLSSKLTSPYDFYQYLYRVPDADVIKFMRLLTFMEMEEIETYAKKLTSDNFSPNEAQQRLAEEVTLFVHGEEGLQQARKVTEAASPGAKADLSVASLQAVENEMPSIEIQKGEVLGAKYVDLAVKVNLLPSKGEATRLIKNGGAYINEEKISDPAFCIVEEQIIGGRYVLLGVGKKKKLLLKIK